MEKIDRSKYLGASESAAALGLSIWKSPLQLYLEKIGETVPEKPSIKMRRGTLLEPLVLELFEEEKGVEVIDRQTFLVGKHPWMSCTIDGAIKGGELVEAKTTSSEKGWGEPYTDQIPAYYLTQCLHQMIVTGMRIVWVPVLIGETDFRIYKVDYSEEVANEIESREVEFWNRVLFRNPPEPRSASDMLALFPQSKPSGIQATFEALDLIDKLKNVKDQITCLESQEKEFGDALKMMMGENEAILSPDGKPMVTWKTSIRTILDQVTIKKECPEIATRYSKTSSTRTFLVK